MMRHKILLILALLISGCNLLHPRADASSYYRIIPADSEDENDVEWADYLISHLDNRCSEAGAVKNTIDKKCKEKLCIVVDYDESMKDDYAIHYDKDKITINGVNKERMLWIIYQLIELIGSKDHRFETMDLPSTFLNDGEDASGKFAFEYRAVYSPFNADPEMFPIFGTSNIDSDWAIWGHNLKKVLPENIKDVFARTPEGIDKNQFCFTSEQLYQAIERYIVKNFDPDKPARFCIMPNDNDVACQCLRCKGVGNTPNNVTPAVTQLIKRLAKRFPNFLFVTSYYKTTAHLPKEKLPKNVGVLISAVNLPLQKGFAANREGIEFAQLLDQWRRICPRICIWEYNCNYDDYFTPYPCLSILQERLKFYKKHGVNGIVFNGAGYYYTTWGGMQNIILSQLLINPDIDIHQSWQNYFRKIYPKTHTLIIPYYENIERRAYQSGKKLPLYAGIQQLMRIYLNPNEFNTFFEQLESESKKTTGSERKRLNRLLTALNYTRIEIARQLGGPSEQELIDQSIENLEGHTSFKMLDDYRETNGKLDNYLDYLKKHPVFLSGANTLKGKISTTSHLDEDYPKLSMLTDGRLGIPTDYHTNWLINSSNEFLVHISSAEGSRLELGFMDASQWRIFIPQRICLIQNGKTITEIHPSDENVEDDFARLCIQIPLNKINKNKPFEIRIVKNGHSFAIDEIHEIK